MKKLIYTIATLFAVAMFFTACETTPDPPGSISGIITDGTNPLQGAAVRLNEVGTQMETGSDGFFQFSDLPAGEYTLTVGQTGFATLQSRPVTVVSGQNAQVNLQLQRTSSSIFGRIVSTAGVPINAAIWLTPGGTIRMAGNSGQYNIPNLQAGRHELRVFAEGFMPGGSSIDLSAGVDYEVVITMTANEGNLSMNKSHIDMGATQNAAGFSLVNSGDTELAWSITNTADWITRIEPESGIVPPNSSEGVVFTINRSRLSPHSDENYATLIARTTTVGDGSTAGLLVIVSGTGDGTNITIGDGDFVTIHGLVVQTQDLGGVMNWATANTTCGDSRIGGFSDWRLPTIGELALLYSNRNVIGGFVTDAQSTYWSSTGSFDTWNNRWNYDIIAMANGQQSRVSQFNTNRVRCVRLPATLPAVSTLAPTNVTANAATLNARIDNPSDIGFTERGFVFSSTFQNPTIYDDPSVTTRRVVSGTSTYFSANVAGLVTGRTYHVRAYVINSNGVVYGESRNFVADSIRDYIVLQADGIMVQRNDISAGATWTAAGNLCRDSRVGGYSNWRLPTRGELTTLFNNRTTIGGFVTTGSILYWGDTGSTTAWTPWADALNFTTGAFSQPSPHNSNRVRCVRPITP